MTIKVSRRAAIHGALGVSVLGFAGTAHADEPTAITVTVSPDGTADFLSPKLANASIVDSSASKPYVILVYPGVYTETEWTVAPFTTVRGTSRADCVLAGSLPDSATDSQITNTSTLWLKKTAGLENLTITAVNMRYAVHSENSGANINAVHLIKNCHLEHRGNEGARAWRRANPGSGMSPSTVWASERPWGYGSASGVYERFENCTLVGPREPWYVHTNKDFTAPNRNELIDCQLVQTGPLTLPVLTVQSLGSGQADTVELRNCTLDGIYIQDDDRPWITQQSQLQLADHAETSIALTGCSPVGYRATHRGTALKLESLATGDTAGIAVSGDAADLILGATTYRQGGGGLRPYLYGRWDISGILVGLRSDIVVANTLGRRLGNCALAPRTLVVTVDQSDEFVISFTEDLTTATNATILAAINSALAGRARALEYVVTGGEKYPTFSERECRRHNGGAEGIPRWAAVVKDSGSVRIARPGDGALPIAGVALEQLGPGASGRILKSGVLSPGQMYGLSGVSVPTGTAVFLSDEVAGKFSLTGTRQVGIALFNNWIRFDPTA